MNGQDKVREQLRDELVRLRRRVAELEGPASLRAHAAEGFIESNDHLRLIIENTGDLISLVDTDGRYVYVSPSHQSVLGYDAETMLGMRPLELIHPDDRLRFSDWREAGPCRFRVRKADGSWVWLEGYSNPVVWKGRPYVVGCARDIDAQDKAEAELRLRSRQRAAIAQLGQRALSRSDLPSLMDEAVNLLSENLGVEYAKVLELLPEGEALLLRAGVGWKRGLEGTATVGADRNSQAGFTLLSDRPVIVEDLGEETRFEGPTLLREHGVVSGMSVIIAGAEQPFGVLGAHTKKRRIFTENDVNFLQAIANVLAAAIERKRGELVFRSTFEQAAVGIAHTAPDGRWLRVNKKLCGMLGYTLEELHERTFEDVTHPDDLESNREHVKRLLAGEVETLSIEKRYIHKDGSTLWAHLTTSLVRDDRGEPKYFIAVVEDIGSRKRAEKALKESQERYKVLYEHNPTMYLTADTTCTILSINEFGAEQLGYSPEELVGRHLGVVIYEDDQRVGLRHIRACLDDSSRVTHGEFRKVRKDGSVLWVKETARAMPMSADDDIAILIVCEDITEDKALEEALEEQAQLLELTHDVVIVRDMAGRIQFWNRGAEETFGWSRGEALGEEAHKLLKTTFPQPPEQIETELLRNDRWEGELEHLRRDGSYAITSSRWALRRDDSGRPVAVLETNNDITEHKKSQQAMYEIREAERRRIARDLHDIVLQDLVSALQALQYVSAQHSREARPTIDLDQEIGALRRAASGLGSAIHELRMDKGEPFLKGVESLVELNRQMVPERRIELDVEEGFPQQLPEKLRVELLRVIQEALTNARRHSRARRVRVSLRVEDTELQGEIVDDGAGFDLQGVPRGVGLSGMRERAAALGGELKILSEPGEGTRLVIRIPFEAIEDGTPGL